MEWDAMNDLAEAFPNFAMPMEKADSAVIGPCECDQRRETISLDNVTVRYGDHVVVEDVSLSIRRNSVTAFIGPSGCGKSSLLYCMNRMSDLIPGCKVSGSVCYSWLDNARLGKDPILLRRHVGMLFQRPNPFPFSIWRNIEFALKEHGVRNRGELSDRIESALKEVGLWQEVHGRLDAHAGSLSGGQQQRLCLARALALDPSVLLMDEPCSALDPISTQKIEDLIQRLAEHRTIVLVTHSLGQARRVADQVALFWKLDDGAGRLIEQAPAETLFEQPRHDLTRTYLEFA
jgi:phosphate transport system ATP-binding protein